MHVQQQKGIFYVFGGYQLPVVQTICADCVWQYEKHNGQWQKLQIIATPSMELEQLNEIKNSSQNNLKGLTLERINL